MITGKPISSDMFKQSMRFLAGGVCILATNNDGDWNGLTITAVCSLTIDPPSLVACVNRNTGTHGIMCRTKRVSINVLSYDQTDIAELFSSSAVRGPQRFDKDKWTEMASGVPVLLGALAVMDCEVVQQTSVGQHSVFFCEVKNVVLQPDRGALVHFNQKFFPVQSVC
ncbi:MAG: flavin reductase family protein [Rhizobiales bacterium]|nr:flavin reductase family protein [Hyphomicrobiales bacterium]